MISAQDFFAPLLYRKRVERNDSLTTRPPASVKNKNTGAVLPVFPAAALIPVKDVVVLTHRTLFYCRKV